MTLYEEKVSSLKEYGSICASLNLDKSTADEAWNNYEKIKKETMLEGDQRPYLGCAIYVACRKAKVQTVGRPSLPIEGNLVSLASLLRVCDMSVLDFFKKCKRWMEWSECSNKLKARLDHLERKFTVSMVIFLKYRPIFIDLFKEPVSSPQHKSKKQRTHGCSISKLFDFTWTLFLCLKSRVPCVAEDLVNSFHLLIATCDLVYANVLAAERNDLLNPDFPGMPSSLTDAPQCIVDELCRRHGALSLEALFAKTYCLRPQLTALLNSGTLNGLQQQYETLLLPQYFDANMRGLDKAYAEYVVSVGDFDERIFLSEDASDDIGARTRPPEPKEEKPYKREASSSNVLITPLSGQEHLKDKESPSKSQTPLASVTMNVRLFMNLISGRPVSQPSENLKKKLNELSENLESDIAKIVTVLGKKFVDASLKGQVPGHESTAMYTRRLEFASTLYYRVLENILAKEQGNNAKLKELLERDIIHQSVFACCLEIVMFSYNANRPFPWVLDALEIEPYYFYRVIEIILRAEESFSRGPIKHLQHIEEKVLESAAWRSDSPLWAQLEASGLPAPKCEEVAFANQLLNESEMRKEASVTSRAPQLSDRYSSPVSRQVRPGQSVLSSNYKSNPSLSSATDPRNKGTKPARTGSLALFFRKFYILANLRMQDLCTRLEILDINLKRKIWTCFEYSIANNTELMRDRHLDQLLMCAVYVMCRVLHTPSQPTSTQFTDILKVYRNQPQAESSVYRNVLLASSKSSTDKKEDTKDGETESPVKEERGNLILFYNTVYMHKIQEHARKYAPQDSNPNDIAALTLSPLPRIHHPLNSPSKKLSSRIIMNHKELCPTAGNFDEIAGNGILIHNSPAKNLNEINEQIRNSRQKLPIKRILSDPIDDSQPKRSQTFYKKLNSVMRDRLVQ